ncbi:uncharacterized protein LOC131018504 [Salvia miltiorrhiza]|uniref:uncharacterized protein LOC131018504 n=1 Tax=Salvia miltiorrhiza TaxID=226208 RepID=UPI0025AD2E11|nr:uncharacterized protein LOC131018504 [Salvia miltiorrhiza]
MLAKVNVNLPLLDVTRNVPAYVKFFKELASKKRKFVDNEKILVSEVTNSIMQQPLPPKQRDPGSFVINITLGNGKEASGMLDLGAGINLMPYSIFKQLELGDLKPTRMCLQLADRSVRYPRGVCEDRNATVNDMGKWCDGRWVWEVKWRRELREREVESVNSLMETISGFTPFADAIDGLAEMVYVQEQEIVEVFAGSADMEEFAREAEERERERRDKLPIDEPVVLEDATKCKKPKLELKELPKHLKYVYLEEGKEKPVIISAELTHE